MINHNINELNSNKKVHFIFWLFCFILFYFVQPQTMKRRSVFMSPRQKDRKFLPPGFFFFLLRSPLKSSWPLHMSIKFVLTLSSLFCSCSHRKMNSVLHKKVLSFLRLLNKRTKTWSRTWRLVIGQRSGRYWLWLFTVYQGRAVDDETAEVRSVVVKEEGS